MLYLRRGQVHRAIVLMERALPLARERLTQERSNKHGHELGTILSTLAACYLQTGDPPRAVTSLAEAEAIASMIERGGDTEGAQRLRSTLRPTAERLSLPGPGRPA